MTIGGVSKKGAKVGRARLTGMVWGIAPKRQDREGTKQVQKRKGRKNRHTHQLIYMFSHSFIRSIVQCSSSWTGPSPIIQQEKFPYTISDGIFKSLLLCLYSLPWWPHPLTHCCFLPVGGDCEHLWFSPDLQTCICIVFQTRALACPTGFKLSKSLLDSQTVFSWKGHLNWGMLVLFTVSCLFGRKVTLLPLVNHTFLSIFLLSLNLFLPVLGGRK